MNPEQLERLKVMYLKRINRKFSALLWIAVPYVLYKIIIWCLAFEPVKGMIGKAVTYLTAL